MLELSVGDLSLGLVPEAGGAIAWLTAGELDVLRRGDPTIDPTAAACFPLGALFRPGRGRPVPVRGR